MVESAFVVLFDVTIMSGSSRLWAAVANNIDKLRLSFSLSRSEAQYILNHTEEFNDKDRMRAAFVLLYEGVGEHRVERDYDFSLEELQTLSSVRSGLQISLEQATDQLLWYSHRK